MRALQKNANRGVVTFLDAYIREVIVAYYHFIEEGEQESLLDAENDVLQNVHVIEERHLHNNNPLQKIINWFKRI